MCSHSSGLLEIRRQSRGATAGVSAAARSPSTRCKHTRAHTKTRGLQHLQPATSTQHKPPDPALRPDPLPRLPLLSNHVLLHAEENSRREEFFSRRCLQTRGCRYVTREEATGRGVSLQNMPLYGPQCRCPRSRGWDDLLAW